MVAYFKNNFFLVPIVVLLFFVISSHAKFSTKVTKSEIIDICKQKDRDFNESVCFEVLESIPEIATLDYSDLAKYLINYDSRKISYMMKQFQSLENSTTDRSSKGSYKVCSGTFDLAIGCFDTALRSLADKDYLRFYDNVGCTVDMAATCRDELSTVVKANPQLFKDISFVRDISFIVLLIRERFLCKGLPRC
ncbi:PREDICTED: uncharacterized protein LOC104752551 [Camelina sativa]|uniref:Uncharacterized protein LOC104752551 n=1 Tax=Camelina sativa TaxID=90675 RepID=A0ABM0WM14_CAMSA|nr:PREDICTED: uncharacterized protein LOC104752551 [Camelina sativa]